IGLWGTAGALDSTVHEQAQTRNPIKIISAQLRGSATIGSTQIVLFIVGLIILTALIITMIWAIRRQLLGTSRVDHLANKMSNAKDFSALTAKSARTNAEQLGADNASVGVPLAKLVNNGKRLFA